MNVRDQERLDLLRWLGLHEPLDDPAFDRLARLASKILRAPVARVTIVEPERQYFIGAAGLSGQLAIDRETPISHSYCRHAVDSGEALIVDDARLHPLTKDSPAIAAHDAIAYAGVPVAAPNGVIVGTVCAIDGEPRAWSEWEIGVLRDLAALAATEIELRVATQVARHEAEELFRASFEQAAVGMAHVAIDGTLLRFNDRFLAMTGYTAAELRSLRLQDLEDEATRTHPDTMPRVAGDDAKSLCYTLQWRHSTGRLEWIELTLSSIRDVDGQVLYMLAVADDITRQRHSNQRLRAQHAAGLALAGSNVLEDAALALARALGEALAWEYAVVWFLDDRGELLRPIATWSGSPTEMRAFDLATRSLVFPRGVGLPGTVWASDVTRWVSPLANDSRLDVAQTSGLVTVLAAPIRAGNQSLGIIELYSREQREPDQELILMLETVGRQLGQFVDLRRAEERGRRSARQFSAVFERAAVGIVLVTPDGLVIEANVSFRAMLDRGDELRGLHFTSLLHPDDATPAAAIFDRLLSGEVDRYDDEERMLRRDGGIVWGHLTASTIENEDGTPRFMVCVIEDITTRKEAEAALAQRDEELRQAQKMEAVGRLAGGVAHDFNNLLTVITAYGGMAMSQLDPATEMYADIREVVKAGERAAALTQQLLAFSRKQVLQPQSLDLSEVVEGTERMIRRLIGEDVDIQVQLERDPWLVRADRGQLEQVLMNLVVNGRDAMPNGGRLSIVTKNVEISDSYASRHEGVQPGQHVLLTVSDSGVGMDRQTQARAFEPFFTTKAAGQGTGLGLATVYGIVIQSGGHIWFYSEVNQGTTFKIYFPRDTTGVRSAPRIAEGGDPERGTETVLLVEDEEPVRVLVTRILERSGYTVLAAPSSTEAFNIAASYRGPIDILLTDVVMPGLNGRQAADRLVYMRPRLRVLFMSGYTGGEIAQRGVIDEGMAFIQKPFTPESLVRKVREVLDTPLVESLSRDARTVVAVVDDTATNRLLLRGVLHRRYDVLEYDSGATALEAFRQTIPDVVLLDIGMPGLDGVEVVRRIRADPQLRTLVVIAMTGHEMIGDRERFLAAGFTEFITKPVTDEGALADIIDRSLARVPVEA